MHFRLASLYICFHIRIALSIHTLLLKSEAFGYQQIKKSAVRYDNMYWGESKMPTNRYVPLSFLSLFYFKTYFTSFYLTLMVTTRVRHIQKQTWRSVKWNERPATISTFTCTARSSGCMQSVCSGCSYTLSEAALIIYTCMLIHCHMLGQF